MPLTNAPEFIRRFHRLTQLCFFTFRKFTGIICELHNRGEKGAGTPATAAIKFARPRLFSNIRSRMFMKKIMLPGLFCWLLAVAARADLGTNADGGDFFAFKFELNQPLVYALEVKNKKITDTTAGGRTALSKLTLATRLKFRLTPTRTNQDGTTTVYCQPFDYEQDYDISGPGGHLVTMVRGLEVVGMQNGITMIDSAKKIGLEEAKKMKQSFYGYLVSGYFDFDATGRIKHLDGDLPFVDHWKEVLASPADFFPILLPTNRVVIHGSWTNNVAIKNIGGISVNDDGFVLAYVFSREPDMASKGAPLASFSLFESENNKNLTGFFEQAGQRTSVALPERIGSVHGVFHFDAKNGRLVDLKKTERLEDSLSMMVQGNPTTVSGNVEAEITMRLVTP
jgi:hypothetical protein